MPNTAHSTMISEWLASPHRLSAAEQASVSDLLLRYPYLVPARMMHLGKNYADTGFSVDMLQESKLFLGNWQQYYCLMKTAIADAEPIPTIPVETIEEILDEEEAILLDELLPEVEILAPKLPQEKELIQPLYVDNYFQHQGIKGPDSLPSELDNTAEPADEKALMVMMGFDEWLLFLKKQNDAKLSDAEDKAIVRSIWQREKLAAAMGEEDDNIPEAVFEMAINSIDRHEIMVSEPLAEIHVKQGRKDKAIEIYRKLSLQNPEKKTYFAAKINHLNKENLS